MLTLVRPESARCSVSASITELKGPHKVNPMFAAQTCGGFLLMLVNLAGGDLAYVAMLRLRQRPRRCGWRGPTPSLRGSSAPIARAGAWTRAEQVRAPTIREPARGSRWRRFVHARDVVGSPAAGAAFAAKLGRLTVSWGLRNVEVGVDGGLQAPMSPSCALRSVCWRTDPDFCAAPTAARAESCTQCRPGWRYPGLRLRAVGLTWWDSMALGSFLTNPVN